MPSQHSTGQRFTLRVLGGLWLTDPNSVAVALPSRKAAALFGYVALRQESGESRERLAGLFWSDRPEWQARTSLRQCLKLLSDALQRVGFTGLWRDRQRIGIDPGTISLDLHDIAAELANGFVRHDAITADAAPDRIMYGYEHLDASFGAWLHVTRQGWHDRLAGLLGAFLTDEHAISDSAHRAAQSLVQVDPTNEDAQRVLMRHYAEHGNVGAALKQYKQLWDLLGDEYDMEPAQKTQDLIAAIKMGELGPAKPPAPPTVLRPAAPAPEAPGARAETRLPIIAVRPFVRGGPQQDNLHTITFFRRDLLAALVRFREWVVIEALEPDGGGAPGAEAGPPTSRYELEGTYAEDGAAIRLIITLKDAISHRYIWSEQLTVTLARWFEAQQEVVRKLALSLNHSMSAERLSRLARSPGLSSEIYDRWLQGHDLTLVWSHDNEIRAEEIFRSITREAPSFSRAFSSLTTLYNTRHLRNPGIHRDLELEREALKLAQISVNLDPLDTRNQMGLAWSYLMHQRFDQAELHFDLTHQLNPSNPTTLVPCAHGLNYCGLHERALDMAETAIRLNSHLPKFHWGYIMCIRFFMRDFAGCLSAGDHAEDVITDLYGWRAAALAHLGRDQEAGQVAQRFVSLVRQRWRGIEPASEANITDWFLRCFPIRKTEDAELLADGLRRAMLAAAPTHAEPFPRAATG